MQPATDPRRYAAAYTHVKASREDEILLLTKWLEVPIPAVTIVAPGKQNLQRSGVVQKLIAAGASATSTRQRAWGQGANVLALWLDDSDLAEIEASLPAKIALAPWILSETEIWRRSRAPIELSGADVPKPASMDPVVRAAMNTVVTHSNPNNGCHSYNRDGAVHAFRVLRRAGYVWDPVETAVVMAQGGWRLDDAREFAKLAADMLAGKALRGGESEFRPDILKIWRKEATEL